jgi:hypothetical protein
MVAFIGGTTLATMTPSISDTDAPEAPKRPSKRTPYSSAVRSCSVRTRQ